GAWQSGFEVAGSKASSQSQPPDSLRQSRGSGSSKTQAYCRSPRSGTRYSWLFDGFDQRAASGGASSERGSTLSRISGLDGGTLARGSPRISCQIPASRSSFALRYVSAPGTSRVSSVAMLCQGTP